MTEDALTFNPDGTCECIYTENIDLRQLGILTISRASDIVFSRSRQEWDVYVKGELLFSHASREECLRWEREHFAAV